MTTVRDLIQRDIGVKVEGVVKVFDHAALATEMREYVVTDKIEDELKRIFDSFTRVSETLRRGGPARDVMGIWVSGFFGSGKSHFAKVLGHIFQNTQLGDDGTERCIDAFVKHLSDTARGCDIRLRLGEIKLNTETRVVFFEIKSRQPYGRPESAGEIILSEFYRFIGYSENLYVAALERGLERRGLLGKLEAEFEKQFGVPWRNAAGRDDTSTVRSRLAAVLPAVAPADYPDQKAATQGLKDAFHLSWLTPEKIADELVAWVDAQKPTGGKAAHLVFVVDEMGTFIGDSNDRISELNSLAEMIGNKGKGKVWLIVTSQQDLEKVVDRTNFQPALVGRLNARFELKPHLISDEINKVVSERILKKRPALENILRELYRMHEGPIAQLADLKASRHLGALNERAFIDAYPLLPHQIRLAQDIFEALSGFRISGGVRSMISVVMETLQDVAGEDVGVLVGFDQIFDAVENDLLSQEYLGASGVRAIYESDERVPGTPIAPARVLKVLWLLQRVTWVPRVPETIAKLLVRDLVTDVPALREMVEKTLAAIQAAGYVSRDEATGEWKFLNERERSIEQAIQEMVRPGGPRSISLAAVRRTSQQMGKEDLLTKKRLANFAVAYGATRVPFGYGVRVDGEAVDTGPELEVQFISPLAPGRSSEIEEVRRQNQAGGVKGRTVWWVAEAPKALEARLKRYEALVKVTGDKRFVDDTSSDTQDALSEKRKERDELRGALVRDIERAFQRGTVFYGGQEIDLEGGSDLKEPVAKALTAVIPNVYPRFAIADKPFDFAKQLKAVLNPATSNLSAVAPDLDLFDTQGSLQRDAALVGQVLEVLRDIEDEGVEPAGAALLDAKEAKGFKGFCRAPFGWPDELVRLVLAACFRAGAIYLERQSGAGPAPVYDYKGSDDYFAKVNTFKKILLRVAETSLSIEQIKQASKALIGLGVNGIPESGNAIAGAVRELGAVLKIGFDEARLRSQQGLPMPDAVLGAEAVLAGPTTASDPTVCVTSFLKVAAQWKALSDGLKELRTFLDANRHKDFELSRKLDELAANHPLPESHAKANALDQARRDMAAIAAAKEVIGRWPDYRNAFEKAFAAYRDAYVAAHEDVRVQAEATVSAVWSGAACANAPADQRDTVVDRVFGPGRVCHYAPLSVSSVPSLLDAAGRRSLTSLAQALVALPGYRAQVEAELRELVAPPPPPDEQVYEWRPADLMGRRFKTEGEVDDALGAIADELKTRIRKGFTVVVK
ncbi:MAG: BREX system P-loop protein BrxC [Candidatus Schekmanbacteria bacterium]|nr:BREX system P-loop protein BrxC [Candidatus Schekmanbacteria bacterium]